jgi:peroxiredoxin
MRQAYAGLKSARFEGQIKVSVDGAEGQQGQSQAQKFVSGFQAPNKFRHELGDDLVVGSSARGLFAYNTRSNSFLIADAPDPKAPLKDIPSPVPAILMQQNPSLFMALEKNPLSDWTGAISRVEKAQDVQIDGQSFTALKLQGERGIQFTAAIDPKTHLVRRITADLKSATAQGGASSPKSARLVIDYTKVEPGASFPENHFAWLPPQGATDAGQARAEAVKQQESRASQGGQTAPDFSLTSLSGKEVKLSDLKGQVVVLDFWASWCPPCRESLPHLGKLYGQNQDGVKVLAVNMGEDADAAKSFVQSQNLNDLTVLLDKDKSVAQKYGISSIPTTVIIGPDGKVQRTFVGLGPDTFPEIKRTVSQLKSGGDAVTAGARQGGDAAQQGGEQKQSQQKQSQQEQGQSQQQKQ